MRVMIFLFSLLITCNYHTGVVIKKGLNLGSVEVKINDTHYILPLLTLDEFDNIVITDTLLIHKSTLRLKHD